MNSFCPEKIHKTYTLPYIKIKKEFCNVIQSIFRENELLFKLPKVSPVINDANSTENRILLLREDLKKSRHDLFKRIKLDECKYEKKDLSVRRRITATSINQNNDTYFNEPVKGSESDENIFYIIELDENWFMRLPKNVFHKLNDIKYAEYGVFIFNVGYKYLSYIECVKQCIPENIEVISSFETIGHIAHLNLNREVFPYRYVIGKILLDKNPGIKTVVTKTGNIQSVFRTYPLEIIAGENNLTAKLKEQGIIYNIEIDKVYWNSRLSNERQTITELIPKKSIVFDLTCGVGAFTIPLVKLNECLVYSNDLNPDSIKLLEKNILLNKLPKYKVVLSQKDCIECIHFLLENRLNISKLFNLTDNTYNFDRNNGAFYWICNLPELSLDILSGFREFYIKYRNDYSSNKYEKTINRFYFYCFSKNQDDPTNYIKNRINHFLEFPSETSNFHENGLLLPINLTVREVRDVSPNKKMFCAQFDMIIPILIL
ncbi:Trm5 RNA methyltransferase [Cryptosporidium bovis]|uniref:Trm5 RNA methyltransferase n=1 Tax=Cryptosporidium bovis TaxID=310047 RepID=UPI00351A94E4|nr:Trm5 RNA methyltransferase [Cryptosporidium bovis]